MKNIALFLLALLLQVFHCTPSPAQQAGKDLTLEQIWNSRTLYPVTTGDMVHMKDGEHYCISDEDGICMYDYVKGNKVKTLAATKDLTEAGKSKPVEIEEFTLSDDESKILITTNSDPIYRYSVNAEYYIYDMSAKKLSALSEGGKQRVASFSADGSKVAFTRGNNIFIRDLMTGKEEQITKDGAFGTVINGTTDWVYEEELDMIKAYWWSPDGSRIVYMKFDESRIPEFTIVKYGSLYPENYKYKYPKAGEANSVVSVWVYDLKSKTTVKVDAGEENDQYIPRVYWTKEANQLAILRMNRLQNKVEMLLADAATGQSRVVWVETNKYYVDITDNLYFLEDKNHFIATSERSGYNHIWMFGFDGSEPAELTHGNYDVAGICAVDDKNKLIYYKAAEDSPMNNDLYCMHFDGKGKVKLSNKTGHTDAVFTPLNKYFFATWSDINTPPVVSLCDNKGRELRTVADNASIVKILEEARAPRAEYFVMKNSEGMELNGWMIKPRDFDPAKKYPVLMYTYGGPGSLTTNNAWGYYYHLYDLYMAQLGYIVVSVDGRGTGLRGEAFRKCTYLQLGKYETMDQVEAAKYLAHLPYVDPSRIGIWGWSYGGFLSALCLMKGNGIFKAAMAVAPVTNWRYYDDIYTERFMRTPQENPKGYDDNSPLNFAGDMKGNFLMVHGTADNNVHMQNSMELAEALVNAGIQFEMQYYTNKEHSIRGAGTRLHLFKRMTDFLLKNL